MTDCTHSKCHERMNLELESKATNDDINAIKTCLAAKVPKKDTMGSLLGSFRSYCNPSVRHRHKRLVSARSGFSTICAKRRCSQDPGGN